MISLCMIVKDEEATLEKCLESVKSFVDEIIVVDTGSRDKTREIALGFTDKVFDFPWCNNFAKARNFSIAQASNDWILVLDADEETVSFHKENLQKIVGKDDKVIGRIKRKNIFNDGFDDTIYNERVNRFFNKKYFKYEGIIHEQIISISNDKLNTVNIPIEVNHVGYTKEVMDRTRKLHRNITLLEKALEGNKEDSYILYQLGKSYYMKKDYDKANKFFKFSMKYMDNFQYEYALDTVITYGYSLIKSERFNELNKILNLERYYKNYVDFQFLKALILMNLGEFQKSVDTFLLCTTMGEGTIDGVNSYKAFYNIGVMWECLGNIEEAIRYYEKSSPYVPAKNRLINIKK